MQTRPILGSIILERSGKAFFDIWWLTLPFAVGIIIALLILNVRWVLDGGPWDWDAAAYLPFLMLGGGFALWALLPAALYLAGAPDGDERSQKLVVAWQRGVEELGEWISLPVDMLRLIARWGILAAIAAFGAWFLIAGDESDFGDTGWIVPAAVRFTLFVLLYLNFVLLAGIIAGLWALLRHETGERERFGRAREHSPGNEA
jgi:hypothetical protein